MRRFAYYAAVTIAVLWYTIPWEIEQTHGQVGARVHRFQQPSLALDEPLKADEPLPLQPAYNPMVGSEEQPTDDPVHGSGEPTMHDPIFSSEQPPLGAETLPIAGTEETLTENSTIAAVEKLLQTWNEKPGLELPAEHNRQTLLDLTRCIYNTTCSKQPRLVIFVSPEFHNNGILAGGPNRERSILRAFNSLNVSYVYSPNDMNWAQSVYALFPSQVRAVIFDPAALKSCFQDTRGCLRSPDNLQGIPAWKMFSYSYLPDGQPTSPLGFAWTLSPELFTRGQTYVGYSIERSCRSTPFIEPADRLDRAFILANLETYFWRTHNVWPAKYFEDVGQQLGAQFAASLDPVVARLDLYPETKGHHSVPTGLVELNGLSPQQWLEAVSKSKLLIGLWDPREMAEVFEALCLGVPFLNPIHDWDASNPTDTTKWLTQNTGLINLGPPYVYHVFAKDYDGFKNAIADALTHPIGSYIREDMTEAAVQRRVAAILDRDWKAEAQAVLDSRKASGEGVEFLL
ncbi:hypothetical protein B0H11DRAFT_1978816 [Mycena galericulata]|nr:hypothetical protein B0H11DRAFT_1978816 [Mycena galericulata]